MLVTYAPLEAGFISSFDQSILSFSGTSPTLSTATALITVILFMLIAGAAFYRLLMSGIYRLEASENGVRRSNEAFKAATFGLLGVFLMFLIFFTFNRDILRSDVGLSALNSSSGGVSPNPVSGPVRGGNVSPGAGTQSGGSPSCANTTEVISKIKSSGGICSGTTCTVLSGCDYSRFVNIIKTESLVAGVDPRMVAVIMCKESRAQVNAQGRNPNGTYDCGLMQINQPGPCGAGSLDPAINIRKGVQLIKQKTNAVNQSYSGMPQRMGVLASYNCCANGTVPHSESADCSTSSGFPFSIPKWACPINPGEGQFNMCTVKNYVCGIEACISEVRL